MKKTEEKKKLGIIGYGRFGKTLHRLFKGEFDLYLYDENDQAFDGFKVDAMSRRVADIKDLYKSVDTVFYAVPIPIFEKVIYEHKCYFQDHLLVDTCSVKVFPGEVFKKYLKDSDCRSMLCHPMFGPDSSQHGFKDLPVVLDKFTSNKAEYDFWKNYLEEKGLSVAEMTADEHDKKAAYSQGIAHFMGRLLDEMNYKKTDIDTVGAQKLFEIMDQTCNDTWELFWSLQNFNPHTREMRVKLGKAYDKLYNVLLPKKDEEEEECIFGIQGGPASFNEQAILDYLEHRDIKKFKIKYLYTTDKVLISLEEGSIDFGIFAIQNSIGGLVDESINAMGNYKYKIKERIKIKIRHFLMKRKDVNFGRLKTIMGHPQVLIQCKHNLEKKYPQFLQKSGEGDMIDTATAGKALADGKLSKDVAILGSKRIAELYNLEIIDSDLQDELHDERLNLTDFLLVER